MRYVITSEEDARAIIDVYTNKCRNCGECSLTTPRDGGAPISTRSPVVTLSASIQMMFRQH